METTERMLHPSYSAKRTYQQIVDESVKVVDYVAMFEMMLKHREMHQRWLENHSDAQTNITQLLDFNFYQITGPRQTGKTLAIQAMATEPTDLVFVLDEYRRANFRHRTPNPESPALVVGTHLGLKNEMRSNFERISALRLEGKLHTHCIPEGFIPKRIFVDDATLTFESYYDPRTIFRWARARFQHDPIIIAVG
ncbi:hypothetical protein LUCX_141 [Xanthomonas phage vB_XciM_LucasX]|nr:hypothetical protein LUCX_141 [Xanthomonas phage vB_XciM_LucasX]